MEAAARPATKASAVPMTPPITQQDAGFAQDDTDHFRPARAERHADADFVGPTDDHIGHNAVEPDGSEEHGERAEKSGECGHQTIAQQRVPKIGFEDVKVDSDIRTDAGQRGFFSGDERAEGEARAHDDVGELIGLGVLSFGDKGNGTEFLTEVAVFCVFDDAHDFITLRRLTGPDHYVQDSTERASAIENPGQKRLIHDGNWRRGGHIVIGDVAACEDRRSQGCKVAWCHTAKKGNGFRSLRSFDPDEVIPEISGSGNDARFGCRLHAGDGANAIEHFLLEGLAAVLRQVEAAEIKLCDQDSILAESGI